MTPAEQAKLDRLKTELIAAAELIRDRERPIIKAHQIVYPRQLHYDHNEKIKAAHTADEVWFNYLASMYLCQKCWADYLKGECDNNHIPAADDDAKNKEWAGEYKKWADFEEKTGRAAYKAKPSMHWMDWGNLNSLLVPAQNDWDKLVAAENAYRDALRKFEVI